MEDNVNGFRLNLNKSHLNFADKIQSLIDDHKVYKRFAENSRDKYENELNWDVWKEKVKEVLK